MATFTSKTLIPGQTPVGQNRDGSYIYEEVMSKATTAPKPFVPAYTPPTAIPMVKSPAGFNVMPQVNKEVAQKVNAPVKDSLGLNSKIDSTAERTTQLREHFRYLEDKGELFLNDKQSDYIKRFKTKYPDYQNVPDAILYGKVILTDPKTMEKYGNIGEKSFLQRAVGLPLDIAKSGGEALGEGIQSYKDRMKPFENESFFNKPYVSVGGGTALQYGTEGVFNIAGDLLNLISPKDSKKEGTTSTTELLGKNVGETIQGAGKFIDKISKDGEGYTSGQIQEIVDLYKKTPFYTNPETKAITDSIVLGWSNLVGVGAGKKITGEMLENTVKEVAERGATKFRGAVSQEAFDAGMNKGLVEGLSTGAKTTKEWLRTLPDETQKIASTVEKNVNKNKEVLQGIRNTQTGEKILSKADNQGFDPIDDISRYEELQPVIDSDGRIDTTQAIDNLNAFVEPRAKTVRNLIEAENKRISLDEFASNIKKEIATNKSDIVNNPRWRKLIDDAIETARRDFGDANGTIPLEVVDDIKKSMYDASNFLNPDDTAIKAIARGAKQTIEDNVLSADIKALNQELSRWYSTRAYLKSIGVGKVIKGGRMGKYFAKLAGQGVGAIAGGAIGGSAGAFAGGVVGGEVADAIQGKILSGAIKKTGGVMPESELFGQAKKTLGESPKQLMPPTTEGLPTSYSSRYSRAGEQLGQGEFPGTNNTGLGDFANPKEITPVATGAGKSLAISAENKTLDVKKLLEKFEQLSPEEKAKAKMASPRLEELVKVSTEIKDIQEFKGDFGYMPPEIVQSLGDNYLNYSPEAKELIRKGLEKEDLAILQKMNREKAGLPEPVQPIKETPTEAPTTTETIEEVVTPVKDTPEVTETPKIGKIDKEMLDELDKYDNAEDFARGVLKSGTKETAGMKQAKVIRDKIEDVKMKALGLDQSSPEFAQLDKEFGKLTKELEAIDSEDALMRVIRQNDFDLEKNIETLKKFYNDNKRANLPKTPQVEGKTATEVLKDWKPTKGGYSMDNIDIKNTNAFPRSQYHRPEYINSDSYKYWLEQAKQGKEIPPIVVEKKGDGYHILDGYHRIAAAEDAGVKNIKALVLDTPINKTGKPFTKFTDEELKNISKPKPSLPLSQKSEVKYSEPDTLVQEAKKYKSAEEFVKAQQKPKSDSVRLYRGMTSKFDKNFDLSKTDAPNGYSTWTDNPELARQYAGDKGHIYQIDLPKKQEGMELLNNDGDRVLFLDNQKKAGLNNVSGKEYLIYNDHDLYNPDLIKEAPTKQQLLDIYNKANKKSALPLSQKSEVKYSKPDPDMEKEIVSVYNKRNVKMDSIQEHYDLIKKDLVEEASTISPEQAVSIEYYKGFGYSNINRGLREGSFAKKGEEYISKNINKLIDEKGNSTGEFYRGVYASPKLAEEFSKLNVGDTFVDKGFMSASKNKRVANEFADGVVSEFDDGTPYVFHIDGKGLDMSKIFKSATREEEVLLNSGNKYEITKIDGNNIFLKQI